MNFNKFRAKRGFTLVELTAALGVAGTMAIVSAQESNFETSQVKARALGSEIYQYNSGVSRFIAANASDPDSVTGTQTGSDWLKLPSCGVGTASESFLSCDILPGGETIQYGISPTTRIEKTADGSLEATTVWETIIGDSGKPDTMVMGLSSLIASGNYVSQAGDTSSGYQAPTVFCPETVGVSSTIYGICGSKYNVIVSKSTINSTSDIWLRTDHGNTMRHVIEFGDSPSDNSVITDIDDGASAPWGWSGAGMRQIVNVARLYNLGSSNNDSIVLGKKLGDDVYRNAFTITNSLLRDSVILDGKGGVLEDFFIRKNLNVNWQGRFGGQVKSGSHIWADGMFIARRISDEDGESASKGGTAFWAQDGGFFTNSGTFRTNEGNFHTLDGTFRTDEGSFVTQDGNFFTHEGGFISNKGHVNIHDGGVRVGVGDIWTEDGRILSHKGNIVAQEGDIVSHEGNIVAREGTVRGDRFRIVNPTRDSDKNDPYFEIYSPGNLGTELAIKITMDGDGDMHNDGVFGNLDDVALEVWGSNNSNPSLHELNFRLWSDGEINTKGEIVTDSYLEIKGVRNRNGNCTGAQKGRIAVDNDGAILYCAKGKWRSVEKNRIIRDDGNWGPDFKEDRQYCETDEILVGGGGTCEDPTRSYMHASRPAGNSWIVDCHGHDGKGARAKAYAICMPKY